MLTLMFVPDLMTIGGGGAGASGAGAAACCSLVAEVGLVPVAPAAPFGCEEWHPYEASRASAQIHCENLTAFIDFLSSDLAGWRYKNTRKSCMQYHIRGVRAQGCIIRQQNYRQRLSVTGNEM